ncbi:uncharacterized protein [Arachis hypogaea]|uniref:uncharacterized protein n=1 Tax=Arachis hypogaea TaxID=3818 RepID=UPI003B2105E7
MINEEDEDDILNIYLQSTERDSDAKSELDRYLKEDCEPRNKSAELDILGWWKGNSTRFPILARMAREVLAIPVSTVASESAFSTGGRIIDPYQSSLTPYMVEALVCTQDWVIDDPFGLIENFEEIEKAEQATHTILISSNLLLAFTSFSPPSSPRLSPPSSVHLSPPSPEVPSASSSPVAAPSPRRFLPPTETAASPPASIRNQKPAHGGRSKSDLFQRGLPNRFPGTDLEPSRSFFRLTVPILQSSEQKNIASILSGPN